MAAIICQKAGFRWLNALLWRVTEQVSIEAKTMHMFYKKIFVINNYKCHFHLTDNNDTIANLFQF